LPDAYDQNTSKNWNIYTTENQEKFALKVHVAKMQYLCKQAKIVF